MRILSLAGGGVASLSLLLASLATATNANPPSRLTPLQWQRGTSGQRAGAVASRGLRRRAVVSNDPSPCPTDYAGGVNGYDYILGVTDPATGNTAAGQYSVVGGGASNVACGLDSAIVAGNGNTVDVGGASSVVGGGSGNDIMDEYSVVGGGYQNVVASPAPYSFIGGGGSNTIADMQGPTESYSAIAGGSANIIEGDGANFIGGGAQNEITEYSGGSSIVGGFENTIQSLAFESSVGGGEQNFVVGSGDFVGAGGTQLDGNYNAGTDAFIGSGDANEATASGAFVGAGGTISANNKEPSKRLDLQKSRSEIRANVKSALSNVASGQDSFLGAGDGNSVSGLESFLGGGYENSAAAQASFIGGGQLNVIASAASYAAIAGGVGNSAQSTFSAILGGGKNTASNQYATIVGGAENTASGAYGVVAGGNGNTAAGELSFAGGYHADAANSGSFVWSDYKSGSATVKDAAANQFVARASGGVTFYSNEAATAGVSLAAGSGTWASLSDRNAKTGIVPLDDDSILAKVSALPVSAWSYKSEAGVRHVGPMAQDFYAAFGVGADSRHITSIDEDGVALAAIKALDAKIARRDGEIARLHGDNGELHAQNVLLQQRLARLELKVDALSSK